MEKLKTKIFNNLTQTEHELHAALNNHPDQTVADEARSILRVISLHNISRSQLLKHSNCQLTERSFDLEDHLKRQKYQEEYAKFQSIRSSVPKITESRSSLVNDEIARWLASDMTCKVRYVFSNGRSAYREHGSNILSIIEKLAPGLEVFCSNDSPQGGKLGNYFQVCPKNLAAMQAAALATDALDLPTKPQTTRAL